jgi:peptidoglycan/LPS O-acetylase OafA/YrhL
MDGRGKGERAPVPPALDGYRGLIILCIVFFHVSRWVQWQPQNAHLAFAQLELNVSGFGVNEVYWFMSIIALFYVLLPFVANRYLWHPLLGLAIAIAIVAVWRALTGDGRYILFIQFPLFVVDFAIGMTAAWLFMRVWRSPRREQLARLGVPAGRALRGRPDRAALPGRRHAPQRAAVLLR